MGDRAPRSRSLATRLAAWYSASAFALLVAATGFLYWTLARSMEREQIEFLQDKLYTLSVVLSSDFAEIAKEVEVEWAGGPSAELFVRILDGAGVTIAETEGMDELGLHAGLFPEPAPMGSALGEGDWHTAPSGRTFELRTLRLPVQGG